MGTRAYGGKGQGKGKGSREGRIGRGGRGRSQGGERPMGTTADGEKGSKGRAADGDRPVGDRPLQTRTIHRGGTPTPPPPPPALPTTAAAPAVAGITPGVAFAVRNVFSREAKRRAGGRGGGWTVKRPRQQPAHPQYANYWAPLTRKRHTMPHSAQSQHANYWAPRTRKRHQQKHRPQRPTESSDPTQHAKGRTVDRLGPRKGATTRRNVTQGDGGPQFSATFTQFPVIFRQSPFARPPCVLVFPLCRAVAPRGFGRLGYGSFPANSCDSPAILRNRIRRPLTATPPPLLLPSGLGIAWS